MKESAEAEANASRDKAAKDECIKDRLHKLNEWDGTVHNGDGSRDFIDGGKVGGANLLVAKGKRGKGEEDTSEKEAREAEVAQAKEEAAKNERLSRLNDWDGLIHNSDGSKEFIDGGEVGGVNLLAPKHK